VDQTNRALRPVAPPPKLSASSSAPNSCENKFVRN